MAVNLGSSLSLGRGAAVADSGCVPGIASAVIAAIAEAEKLVIVEIVERKGIAQRVSHRKSRAQCRGERAYESYLLSPTDE